jgi:hypothetical protein
MAMLSTVAAGAVPVIEPGQQVEADGLSLLKPAESAAVRAGWNYRLSFDHVVVEAFDQRDPDRNKPLSMILTVDQKGFLRALNGHSLPSSAEVGVETVECYFWESREGNGDVSPCFRIQWTLRGPFPRGEMTLEAFSFGPKYSDWTIGSGERRELWLRGAAAAYQATTDKLAVALQKLMAK